MTPDPLFPDYENEAWLWPDAPPAAEAPEPEPNPRFLVDSTAKAEWAMRRVVAARAEIARIAAEAEELQHRIIAWHQQAERRPQRTLEHFEALLVRYHRDQYEQAIADGVREKDLPKSIKLPSGVLRSTAPGKGRLVVDDEDALIEWLDANTTLDVIEEVVARKVQAAKLRAVAVETDKDGETVLIVSGQVAPHVRVERDTERSFTVAPSS
jgi:hypothetical protein